MTIKGTVTRIFVEKDSGFKIVVVIVLAETVILKEMVDTLCVDHYLL